MNEKDLVRSPLSQHLRVLLLHYMVLLLSFSLLGRGELLGRSRLLLWGRFCGSYGLKY